MLKCVSHIHDEGMRKNASSAEEGETDDGKTIDSFKKFSQSPTNQERWLRLADAHILASS